MGKQIASVNEYRGPLHLNPPANDKGRPQAPFIILAPDVRILRPTLPNELRGCLTSRQAQHRKTADARRHRRPRHGRPSRIHRSAASGRGPTGTGADRLVRHTVKPVSGDPAEWTQAGTRSGADGLFHRALVADGLTPGPSSSWRAASHER